MKIFRFLPFLFLSFIAVPLYSQIAVGIRASHQAFLLYDHVFIRMSLRNYASYSIAFGNTDKLRGTIEFRVFDKYFHSVPLRKPGTTSIISNLMLPPGQSKTFTFDLNRLFAFTEPGEYRVRAIIRHPQLMHAYQSHEIVVVIRPGEVIWERIFGIPDYNPGSKEKIRTRKAQILKFFNNQNVYYALRLEDDQCVYALKRFAFDLGPNLKPQVEVDSVSSIHILAAASPRVFAYYIYEYTGKLLFREIYIKTSSKPMLVRNPLTAAVFIDGGRKARKDLDYEEIKDLPFMDEVKEKSQIFGDSADEGAK